VRPAAVALFAIVAGANGVTDSYDDIQGSGFVDTSAQANALVEIDYRKPFLIGPTAWRVARVAHAGEL
jgi:hypothetical protein